MGKKHRSLYDLICEPDNLRIAYFKAASNGNRYSPGHLVFEQHLELNLSKLHTELVNRVYKPGEYIKFEVFEPKKRIIQTLPFRDRVVQHAIHNYLYPIYDNIFYNNSYGCRVGKGTHSGVKDTQSAMRSLNKVGKVYYLKMDYSKYFKSICKDVLFYEIEKKITDNDLIKLLRLFLTQEDGIPIGNLLSQLFANIYGHILDRYVVTVVKPEFYIRYMDDTVILSNSKIVLLRIKNDIEEFSFKTMKLTFSKWYIEPVSKPLSFLGYRISVRYKLLRKNILKAGKRKIKYYKTHKMYEKLYLFLQSWKGYVEKADVDNILIYIKKEIENAKRNSIANNGEYTY